MASQISKRGESCSLILNSAKKLIWKYGFGGVKLQDILDEAKITKGKFFHYYKSKDELFLHLLNHSLTAREFIKFEEILLKLSHLSHFQKLLVLIDKIVEWHNHGLPEIMKLSILAVHYFDRNSPEIKSIKKMLAGNIQIITKLLEECKKNNSLPKSINAEILANLLPSASIGGNTVGYLTSNSKLTSLNILEIKNMLIELNKLSGKKI